MFKYELTDVYKVYKIKFKKRKKNKLKRKSRIYFCKCNKIFECVKSSV